MKKIVFEIIQLVVLYVFFTIYGYYNAPEPDNKYSWLSSAIIIIIIYPIAKIILKREKKKKDFKHCKDVGTTSGNDVSSKMCDLKVDSQIDEHINDSQKQAGIDGNEFILIKYFIDKAKPLSLEYVEQEKIAHDLGLGDYFTEYIANDWFAEEISYLNELFQKNMINRKAIELYTKIDSNFKEVSLNKKFNDGIWTLKGMKEHVFWEKQRTLAKQFIKEININKD